MRRIVQIAPDISPGSGVAAVAYNLDLQWRRLGIMTDRFTMREAHGSWLPEPGPGVRGKLALALRVVWFSTVGTFLARRYLRRTPDAVSICHNDVLAGDIYVNHGLLRTAMRARGHYARRMVRNPLHLFTGIRDTLRYSTSTHRVVVNLTEDERSFLRRMYPRLKPRAVVIPNGVDIEHFHPPAPQERVTARARLGLAQNETVALFVGHEFERKGLDFALSALAIGAGGVLLLVVGGSPDMVAAATKRAEDLGVRARIQFFGLQENPMPYFHAADVLVLPSAYEANALVVLEALACGLPVVATPVGFVPDIIVDGDNGYVVERNAEQLAGRLAELSSTDLDRWRARARATAEQNAWSRVAEQYLRLVDELSTRRSGG